MEDLVMRSVYLKPTEDSRLRQLAFEHDVSKSDLIRAAISLKLEEWLADSSNKLILKDIQVGRRQQGGSKAKRSAAVVTEPKRMTLRAAD